MKDSSTILNPMGLMLFYMFFIALTQAAINKTCTSNNQCAGNEFCYLMTNYKEIGPKIDRVDFDGFI